MKDQADRRGAFFGRFLIVFLAAGIVVYFALDLMRETKTYLDIERAPVMVPGGGARF